MPLNNLILSIYTVVISELLPFNNNFNVTVYILPITVLVYIIIYKYIYKLSSNFIKKEKISLAFHTVFITIIYYIFKVKNLLFFKNHILYCTANIILISSITILFLFLHNRLSFRKKLKEKYQQSIKESLTIILIWIILKTIYLISNKIFLLEYQKALFSVVTILIFAYLTPFFIIPLFSYKKYESLSINKALQELKIKKTTFKATLCKENEQKMYIAVLGFLPTNKYLILSKHLLKKLSKEELKTVLLHETCHIRKKHVENYILLIICALMWINILNFNSFVSMILLLIYFRFIIGWFMRNFERQADLESLKLNKGGENFISALLKISPVINLKKKNWHHFSIYERINFLNKAQVNKNLIKKQNKKLKTAVILTYILFTTTITFYIFQFIKQKI